MSLQETAKFTVELILSSDVGEIPVNEEIQAWISEGFNGMAYEVTGVECLSAIITDRTGELE